MSPLPAWHPHADAWVLAAFLLAGYVYAVRVWGQQGTSRRPAATRRQRLCFYAGVATLWLAADWPVHQLADELFSVHMLQHMVFSLVAAPLMILGVPGWLWRRLFHPRPVQAVVRFITQPLIAFLIFNTWVAVYHVPALVNASVHTLLVHFSVHVVWVVAALIMWWPVLSPLPEFPHLSYPLRGVYLFAQSLVPTVPASFLTFARDVVYEAYDVTPRFGDIPVVVDQQIAGLLMKVGGGLILWGVIAVLFFRWAKEEQEGGPDLLYWRDLEPDVRDARIGAEGN
jgi:putative membrane protein